MSSTSFWKMFSLFGAVSSWAEAALTPDATGKVTITIDELIQLAKAMCDVFGWEVEIPVED